MPQTKFLANKDAIEAFFKFVFSETDCRVYETYSRFDCELRSFSSVDELSACFPLGVNEASLGSAQHFALWSVSVMPAPMIRRIDLKKVKSHSFRYAVEGCGLFSLLLGGMSEIGLSNSTLSYWSEAGARERCQVTPGPALVDWVAHKQLGARLARCAKRLSVT